MYDCSGSFWGGFVPRISPDAHMLLIATSLIGAVVMPHNLYLHSALVLVCDGLRVSIL